MGYYTNIQSKSCLLKKTIWTNEEKNRLKVSATTNPTWRKSFDQAEVRPTSIPKQQEPMTSGKILWTSRNYSESRKDTS